jgi:hypothetical protein
MSRDKTLRSAVVGREGIKRWQFDKNHSKTESQWSIRASRAQ